jgi:hypothetical protein
VCPSEHANGGMMTKMKMAGFRCGPRNPANRKTGAAGKKQTSKLFLSKSPSQPRYAPTTPLCAFTFQVHNVSSAPVAYFLLARITIRSKSSRQNAFVRLYELRRLKCPTVHDPTPLLQTTLIAHSPHAAP